LPAAAVTHTVAYGVGLTPINHDDIEPWTAVNFLAAVHLLLLKLGDKAQLRLLEG